MRHQAKCTTLSAEGAVHGRLTQCPSSNMPLEPFKSACTLKACSVSKCYQLMMFNYENKNSAYMLRVTQSHLTFSVYKQARREPQRGPGKHSHRAPKHFPLGEIFLNFSVQNGTFWRTF